MCPITLNPKPYKPATASLKGLAFSRRSGSIAAAEFQRAWASRISELQGSGVGIQACNGGLRGFGVEGFRTFGIEVRPKASYLPLRNREDSVICDRYFHAVLLVIYPLIVLIVHLH